MLNLREHRAVMAGALPLGYCSLTEFQLRLHALDAALTVQSLQPTLQDAALRELAMAEIARFSGCSDRC